MKNMIACLMAAVLLFTAGCGQNAGSSVSGEVPDEWGITLSAEDATHTGMTLVCTQRGGKARGELQTGSYFVLERFVEGEWLPVGTMPGLEEVWTSEAWYIEPGAVTRWKVDWEWLYGYLDPGSYRISKIIMDFRSAGKYTEKTYSAEFGIDE